MPLDLAIRRLVRSGLFLLSCTLDVRTPAIGRRAGGERYAVSFFNFVLLFYVKKPNTRQCPIKAGLRTS